MIEFESYEFQVTPELNDQYRFAVQDYHPRYEEIVHPGLLLNYSNLTRSPNFDVVLKSGAAVHTKEEVEFIKPGKVGQIFKVMWTIIDEYEKRDRLYTVIEAVVVAQEGIIIRRKTVGFVTKGE